MQKAKKSRGCGCLLTVLILLVVLALGALQVYRFFTSDERLYEQGVALLEAGEYWEALDVFESIPEHPLASSRLPEVQYGIGNLLLESAQYAPAQERFSRLGDYLDSAEKVRLCDYQLGLEAQAVNAYETAYEHFLAAGNYQDAAALAQQMLYEIGHASFAYGDFDRAYDCFDQLTEGQTAYGAPHFRTLSEATDYFEQQRLAQNEEFHFYIGEETDDEFYDTLRCLFPCQYYSSSYYASDRKLEISEIHYYSGDNILNAHKTGDLSRLTEAELQVMDLALQLVAQAEAETDTPMDLEIWLHDWLCGQVRYESPNMDVERDEFVQLRELSCIGAMLDGVANCQGYADAFYLLGNLAGLDVGRIMGYTEQGHIWNTISLDGQLYIVDVTFDDLSDDMPDSRHYTYFNIFWDPAFYDPMGDDSVLPQVTTQEDLLYTYYAHTGNIFATGKEAAESLARQQVRSGDTWTYALVEDAILQPEEFNETLKSILKQYSQGFSWTLWVDHYGGNSCITVYWK